MTAHGSHHMLEQNTMRFTEFEIDLSHNYASVAVALTTLWRRFGVRQWKCPIVQMTKAVVCQIKRAFKIVVFQRLFVGRNAISHEAVSRLHELKRDVLISQVHLIRLHLLRRRRETHDQVLRWQSKYSNSLSFQAQRLRKPDPKRSPHHHEWDQGKWAPPPPPLQAALFTCWIVTKPIEVAGETLAGRSDTLWHIDGRTIRWHRSNVLSSLFFVFHAAFEEQKWFHAQFDRLFSPLIWLVFFFLQLHTADIGGQGTTLEVVQSIMRIIQSKGQLTAEL